MSENFQRIMSKENLFLQIVNQLPSKKNPFLAISSPKQVTVKNRKKYQQGNTQNVAIPMSAKDSLLLYQLQSTNKTIERKIIQISQIVENSSNRTEKDFNVKNFNLNSPKSTTRYFRNMKENQEKYEQQQQKDVLTEVNLNGSTKIGVSSQQNQKSQKGKSFVITNHYKKNYLSQSVLTQNETNSNDTLSSTLSSARTLQFLSNAQLSDESKQFKFEKVRLTRRFRNKENFSNKS